MSAAVPTLALGSIRLARLEERDAIREKHVKHHLDASGYSPEALAAQILDLPSDFPHLFRQALFASF